MICSIEPVLSAFVCVVLYTAPLQDDGMTTEGRSCRAARTLATAGTHHTRSRLSVSSAHTHIVLYSVLVSVLWAPIGLGKGLNADVRSMVGKSRKAKVEGQLCHSGMVAGLGVAFFQAPR